MNEHYGFHTIRDLIHMVYDEKLPHHQIAAFARIVAAVALEGDQTAQEILQQAGNVLALSALAVLKRLGMENAPHEVAAAGSVLVNDRLVRRSFTEALQNQAPQVSVISPRHEAAVGAALMAISEYRKR
jgi:N-acetylglucosamine kinase-like BadF-type ATPase